MFFASISQIIIFLELFLVFFFWIYIPSYGLYYSDHLWWCDISCLSGVSFDYNHDAYSLLGLLYLPNLIAIIILTHYSRIKNVEENAEFIKVKSEIVISDEESTSGDQSPVRQSHVFLVITVVGGMFGLDKAYKGDYLLAVFKLLTLGGLWIWQLYDIYVAAGEAGRSWSLDSGSSRITEKHVILITAIVGGHIGLDRAYKGDGVTGVFKLLTLGGLGIWWLVDVYVAAKEAGKSW
jgi:hypothetical protein